MPNAILEAVRNATPEERREVLAFLQSEVDGPKVKKKVPLPLSMVVGDDEEVALDEHGFPVLSPELEEELARRAREPQKTLTYDEFVTDLDKALRKRTQSR